jgi:putative SOS response-associated peptidase YedK
LSDQIKLVDSIMRVAFYGPRYNIAPTQMAPVIFMENKKSGGEIDEMGFDSILGERRDHWKCAHQCAGRNA